MYLLNIIESCVLKYLLQAQQHADLLLDEALRPMREGLGSYMTTVSDGWSRAGLQSITATRFPIIQTHSPSNSAAGTLKLYRFYHADISKHFC